MPNLSYQELMQHALWKLETLNRTKEFSISKNRDFIQYHLKSISSYERDVMNENWKAHVSVHPDDLEKAWDEVFFPVLSEHAVSFKVSNLNSINKSIDKVLKSKEPHQQKLTELESQKERKTSEEAEIVRAEAECKKLDAMNDTFYRVRDGMQVTIYIPKGEEDKYQWIMGLLEEKLKEHQIRLGQIFDTDRALGAYTSIRHPGLAYHQGTTVVDYNPDKVADPFTSLLEKDIAEMVRDKLVKLNESIKELQTPSLRFLLVGKYISLYQKYLSLVSSKEQKRSILDEAINPSHLCEGVLSFWEKEKSTSMTHKKGSRSTLQLKKLVVEIERDYAEALAAEQVAP